MPRFFAFLLVIFLGSCSKQDITNHFFPLEEEALFMAGFKCHNPTGVEWLREIIKLSEDDPAYKGSIYAIPYSSGTAFLHQPWISSCFGCRLYNCEGNKLSLNESEKTEIISGAKEENVIYTSSR